MRVGIDARLWAQTGVGRYIRNLVSNLQKIDDKNDYVLFARSQDQESIKSTVTNKNWKIVTANIRWHSLKEQYEFPKILNKENLDLVHFPYFSFPIFYKKPFVVTIHDLIMHHYPTGRASTLPMPFYKAKKMGYSKVINNAVKKSKKIIVPLNAVKEDLIKSLNVAEEKIVVTHEGVDKKISNKSEIPPVKIPAKYFLYVGNAYPHKNLERLISAFEIFKKNNNSKDVSLLLIGKNDFFYKRLKKHVEQKNLSSIVFMHDLSDEQLAYLYKNAIALVLSSLMEGFGLPAIEAMSNNCLVMLSNIPSFREVCNDSAIYFDQLEERDIAKKMNAVFKNGKKYYVQNLQKAKIRIKLFSWEKMAKETLKVYESSLKNSE